MPNNMIKHILEINTVDRGHKRVKMTGKSVHTETSRWAFTKILTYKHKIDTIRTARVCSTTKRCNAHSDTPLWTRYACTSRFPPALVVRQSAKIQTDPKRVVCPFLVVRQRRTTGCRMHKTHFVVRKPCRVVTS